MIKQLTLTTIFFIILFIARVPVDFSFLAANGGEASPLSPREEKEELSREAKFDLEAKSAYVFDIAENKIIYEKNSSESRPLASLAKLMTAILFDEKVPDGSYVEISDVAIGQPESEGLAPGDRFKKEDILGLMMVHSSNDAAWAAAEAAGAGDVDNFVRMMNKRARELGLASLSFANPHGLDIKTEEGRLPGDLGNAADIAKLLGHVYKNYPEILAKTKIKNLEVISESGKIITSENTNEAIEDIPRLVVAKTGFTVLSGGNLVFIFEPVPGKPILVSILGSSEKGRFDDARKIVGELSEYYK